MSLIKKIYKIVFCLALALSLIVTGCDDKKNNETNNDNKGTGEVVDDNDVTDIPEVTKTHNFKLVGSADGVYSFECQDEGCTETQSFTATLEKGSDCLTVEDEKITFGAITEETEYSLTGSFYGAIVVDAGEDFAFTINLVGFTLTSEIDAPINVKSSDEFTLSAKKGTENYIYDIRSEVTDDDAISASIYTQCDLSIQGKGSLFVKSTNNNGIHGKDDVKVKNLTLQVECVDNALKGNDGVTIESGNITLIAHKGDAIKTSNSHLSSKGKQKGDVTLEGGSILLYAACDGIDAAHDVIINQDEGELDLQIFTDKYSKYSEEVTATKEDTIYIRFLSALYKYSIEYSNDTDTVWYNSSNYVTQQSGGMGGPGGGNRTYYYYPITKPSGYTKIRVFVYSSTQEQGQATDYVTCTDYATINNSYDTIAVQSSGGGYSFGWTNYQTQSWGGPGGQQEGNTDKGDYSTKGIKADNEILISAGTISIKAYDDAIHTNSDVELGEEGAYYYGTGNIKITGGVISLYSNDDAIHADGMLEIEGGSIGISNSYEGLEGTQIKITGGSISLVSSDDGLNSTATSGTGIEIDGGYLYVYAGGDGLDSNSKTSYKGIVFNGGEVVVISTGNGDSSIDTEQGYTYSGGKVVAVGGGMSRQESSHCQNFSTVGTTSTTQITKGKYLVVKDFATIQVPASVSYVVVLGKTNANISSASTTSLTLDDNGVCFE